MPSQHRASISSVWASGVLRLTSVSSMRRMNCPPVWRASKKLYRAVRAPPMWKWPVGEGAKRTRTGVRSEFNLLMPENHRLHQPNAKQKRPQRASAVAHKGQGQAGDRQKVHVHADIEK